MILPDGYASLMMVSFCSWLEMIAVPWPVKDASSGKQNRSGSRGRPGDGYRHPLPAVSFDLGMLAPIHHAVTQMTAP